MKKDKNKLEIELLHSNMNELLIRYQFIVHATVARFIQRGFFSMAEKSELVQEINLVLLESKLEKIKTNFNGSVYLRTYFSKVVYNQCLEIIRIRRRQPVMVDEEVLTYQPGNSHQTDHDLLIRDEVLRLDAILKSIHRKKAKLILCLQLFARVLLNRSDFEAFHPDTKTEPLLIGLLEDFGEDYTEWNDKMVYARIVRFFNEVEGKNSDADSLRKWFNMQIDKMILLLNGRPPVSNHSRQSMRILLEYYFLKRENHFSAPANEMHIDL